MIVYFFLRENPLDSNEENVSCEGCTFLADGRLIRQVDGCPMGGPISVVLSNIFCSIMEFDVVKPLKPKLYKPYVDDIYSKRIKNQPDNFSKN